MPARVVRGIASLIALCIASPLWALSQGATGSIDQAVLGAQEAALREDCGGVLRALDPVVADLAQGPQRTLVQRMRLLCLGAEGRSAELTIVQQELAKSLPKDGLVKAFGALIAADQSRFAEAAEEIASLADTSPASLDVLTGQVVRAITLKLIELHDDAARGRMMIALARADWQPADLPDLRVGFAESAIGALMNQGEAAEAEALLDRVDQPEMLSAMAVDRRYAGLWPAIEARLGPSATLSVDRFARDRLTVFGDAPDSDVALRDASNAMLLLGRLQDVVDLTDAVPIKEGIGRDAVRALLLRARALAALGRDSEAERMLDSLAKLDISRSPAIAPALVSYAEFLDERGRPEDALAAARAARSRAEELLTDVGNLWLDRTEICTLSTLGRVTEAQHAIDTMMKKAEQNQAAAIEALLCAKRDVEASRLALKAFNDADVAGELLLQFQPAASQWAPAPSRLRDLWTTFLTRPEIKAAFNRKGRILPKGFWPDPKPRPIPRRRGNGALLT